MRASSMVRAERVSFIYPCASEAVGPFDFDIDAGQLKLVHGPSGCGKSTLARLLCGIIPHLYDGELHGGIAVNGTQTTELSLPEITSNVGAVFQNPEAQLLAATVAEEIDFGLECAGLAPAERASRRRAALERFHLGPLAKRDPRRLSGGEQQRVLIAAAAARQPDVLLLDEPLSMLDRPSTRAVLDDIDSLRRCGTAVVAFEHRRSAWEGTPGVQEVGLGVPAAAAELPVAPPRQGALEVRIEGLSVELCGRTVLRDLELELHGGTAVALHGPNGAGKTTLLRALSGLQDHRGRVLRRVDGVERRGVVGLCFQNADHQIFNPTVREELRYGCNEIDEEHYRAVVSLVDLARHERLQPLLLSEGQKKRLALGLLLMQRGLHGLCLDEPTLGQDATNRDLVGRMVRRLVEAGYLCVIATHDEEWARQWCDRSIYLRDGRVDLGDS